MPCKNSLASMVSKASCRKSAAPRAPINSPMTSWTSSTRRVKHTPPVRRLSWPDGSTSNSGSPCIPEALRGPWHAKKKRRYHLVYVRQSTLHQVFEHRESTARQYGLSSTAQDVGWSDHLVEVIDDDLGQSGRSAQYRHGFQRLVADVALGQVGIVMGLEISRLARNNADFQQLLQICGLNQTLIYDADSVY